MICLDAYMSYNQDCSTYSCNPSQGLTCGGTGCSCPTTVSASYCDCPVTKYWDSSSSVCVNRVSYNVACPTGQNYNCISSLVCTAGFCKCPNSAYYWTGSICRNIFAYFYHLKINCWNLLKKYMETNKNLPIKKITVKKYKQTRK